METSAFGDSHFDIDATEPLNVISGTSQCYRVKLYGKQHFLKRLKPELRSNPRYVAAMRKEFETGYNLDHPHLVRYLACGDDYLLTEWIDGVTLSKFAQLNPAFFKSADNTRRLLGELLDVVEYLHSHQIVHLDLKPDNILITRVGNELKLTDLGFCYTDTFSDTMGRTSSFAAPEQLASGGQVDQRTDIYALGRIIATLPCAKQYYKVIARCTQQDKDARYQSIAELRSELSGKRVKWNLSLAIAAIALLLGFAAWWLIPDTKTNVEESPGAGTTAVLAPPADSVVTNKPKNNSETVVSSRQESEQNMTKGEALSPSAAPTRPAMPAEAESNIRTPAPVKKEISLSTLRDEMMALARPCYNRYLKPYESYRLSEINDQYSTILNKCYDAFTPTLIDLWDTKYKNYSNLTMRQYFEEIGEIRKSFDHQFYSKLMKNDANSGGDN